MIRESPRRVSAVRQSLLALLAVLFLAGCGREQPDVLSEQPGSNAITENVAPPRELVIHNAEPITPPVDVSQQPVSDSFDQVFSAFEPGADARLTAYLEAGAPKKNNSSTDSSSGEASPDAPPAPADDPVAESSTADPEIADPEREADPEQNALDSEVDKAAVDEQPADEQAAESGNEASPGAIESGTSKPLVQPLGFPDWPEPELMFFVTGRQHGYIEPCGCTGLENARGGLARRHTLLEDLRKRFGPVTAIDVGNQVRRFGRQAELKFQATIDSLELMRYQAIGFGPDDLKLSTGDLISAVAGADPENTSFVCANVNLLGFTPTHRVIQVGRRRIGLTSVMGSEHIANINNADIEVQPPEEGLRQAFDAMTQEKCELFVLLAHASLDETRELVRKFPKIQIVVTAGGAGEPTLEPERIPGCFAYIVQVGTKGMHAGVVGVFMDPKQPVRYERVPLDARFADSRAMLERFTAYQNDLQQLGFEELGVRPVAHPFDPQRKYAGSEACADCHSYAAEVFAKTPHAHATESLIHPPNARSAITRIHDPECVSCHVTGWDAQQYVPYESGYWDVAKSAHLHASGCENCHGPGSRHVAIENGELEVPDEKYDELVAAYRLEMRLTLEEAKTTRCFECHDLDNSPTFQKPGAFEDYWERIKHYDADE